MLDAFGIKNNKEETSLTKTKEKYTKLKKQSKKVITNAN